MKIFKYWVIPTLLFLFFLLPACPLFGQELGGNVVEEGRLSISKLSTDGKWVSYTMTYESGLDTLYLQSTATKRVIKFPKGAQPIFGGSKYFAYKENQNLIVRHLDTVKALTIPEINQYSFVNEGSNLLTLTKAGKLQLRKKIFELPLEFEVSAYKVNEAQDAVLYTSEMNGSYTVGILNCGNGKLQLLEEGKSSYTNLIWRADGRALLYKQEGNLCYYDLSASKSYKLNAQTLLDLGKVVSNNSIFPVSISDDGKKVFFGAALAEKRKVLYEPEIWNGNDTKLYSVQQTSAVNGIPLVSVWFPETAKIKILTDERRYSVRLSGKNDFMVLCDPFSYGLEPAFPELVDYYVKNVNTGAEKLLLSRQPNEINRLCFSPLNNSMVYFRDKQWWYYIPEKDETICLTNKTAADWDNTDDDAPISSKVYGVAGWMSDGNGVLLYDKYDIWKVALDGSGCIRLTAGREFSKKYRLDKSELVDVIYKPYSSERRLVLHSGQDLLLYVENQDDWSTGIELYRPGRTSIVLDYGPQFLSEVQQAGDTTFVYLTESHSQPSQLYIASKALSKPKLLFNSKLYKGENKKVDLISYKGGKGKLLKGALYYPDNYDPSIQYPMIVRVYEKLSKEVHHYSRPTLQSPAGFNLANFTASGYFVLYPDFELELGNPGKSATVSVVAAVSAAVSHAAINPRKVGLIGHSYGGYETNFIITQTDIFTAAVSGAAISNTIARYFGSALTLSHNDMWRYESQQWRMGSSFFDNKQGYWNNSPITYADKIKTPLLQWHGKKDDTIPFDQGLSYYLALRRLGLKTVLLAYPNEGHDLGCPKNQIDLSKRILQWFDYFLKDKTDVGWITNGTSKE